MAPVNNNSLPPKWSFHGVFVRFRKIFRHSSDLWLFSKIGWFIWRLPTKVAATNLDHYLDDLREKHRPATSSVEENLERIFRLTDPWLRLKRLNSRDTCYTRAFVLYRFLTAGRHELQFNFGIDSTTAEDERLHGHAWITVDGIPYGLDDASVPDNCQIVYTHPSNDNQSG